MSEKDNELVERVARAFICEYCGLRPEHVSKDDIKNFLTPSHGDMNPSVAALNAAIAALQNQQPSVNQQMLGALKALAPFEIVRGDSLQRKNPNTKFAVNTSACWLVSAEYRTEHKLKKAMDYLNRAAITSAESSKLDGCFVKQAKIAIKNIDERPEFLKTNSKLDQLNDVNVVELDPRDAIIQRLEAECKRYKEALEEIKDSDDCHEAYYHEIAKEALTKEVK